MNGLKLRLLTKKRFKVNTGSQVNILPKFTLDFQKINIPLQKCNVTLEVFGGCKFCQWEMGMLKLRFKYINNEYFINFIVVRGSLTLILGLTSW